MGHTPLYLLNLLRADSKCTAGRIWPPGRSLDTPCSIAFGVIWHIWLLLYQYSHHSVALHPGGGVHGVSEQTVARHLQTHHTCHHHPRVNTWEKGGQLFIGAGLKVIYYAKRTFSCLFYINMCPLCVKRFWKFQEKRLSGIMCSDLHSKYGLSKLNPIFTTCNIRVMYTVIIIQ